MLCPCASTSQRAVCELLLGQWADMMLQLIVQYIYIYIYHRQGPRVDHTHMSKLLIGTRKWLRSVHPMATSTPFPSNSSPRDVLNTLSHSATIALRGPLPHRALGSVCGPRRWIHAPRRYRGAVWSLSRVFLSSVLDASRSA